MQDDETKVQKANRHLSFLFFLIKTFIIFIWQLIWCSCYFCHMLTLKRTYCFYFRYLITVTKVKRWNCSWRKGTSVPFNSLVSESRSKNRSSKSFLLWHLSHRLNTQRGNQNHLAHIRCAYVDDIFGSRLTKDVLSYWKKTCQNSQKILTF